MAIREGGRTFFLHIGCLTIECVCAAHCRACMGREPRRRRPPPPASRAAARPNPRCWPSQLRARARHGSMSDRCQWGAAVPSSMSEFLWRQIVVVAAAAAADVVHCVLIIRHRHHRQRYRGPCSRCCFPRRVAWLARGRRSRRYRCRCGRGRAIPFLRFYDCW
jgi:hypothetical protein